jgi:hypothetical protein
MKERTDERTNGRTDERTHVEAHGPNERPGHAAPELRGGQRDRGQAHCVALAARAAAVEGKGHQVHVGVAQQLHESVAGGLPLDEDDPLPQAVRVVIVVGVGFLLLLLLVPPVAARARTILFCFSFS